MATAIQRRRGNTAQHASFTGLAGEITIDTQKNTVVVHDGTTAGGYPLARADEVAALGGADITAVIAGSGLTGGSTSGNATISLNYENLAGNLVPSANNTYSLGTVSKVWKDVFVGPGSLYINGQQVLSDNSGTITVSANANQNLSFVTTGTGDLELTAGGEIQLKSNVILGAGKTLTASGGLKLASNLDVNSQYINNLTNPVQAQDAATKHYVDNDSTVVRTTGTQTIGGAKTFSADLIVSGNLTVSGTTTTVNSETISLADNIIDLNSNFTTGSPTENAGIRIKRGDSADVQVRWNESDDKWQFTNDGSTYADILTGTQVKALFSATDAGGDGSFSYSDGVFTYTGPSQAEANARIDARVSGGNGLTYTSGVLAVGAGYGISVAADTVAVSNSDVRALFSASGDISYNASTGVFSFTNDAGDIESVTAGSGLTGGGITGAVTLNIGAGTGITVNADDVAVNATYVKGLFSATDSGGDGSFSYSDGVFTYTGPSATEVRAHITGGNGLTFNTGTMAVGAGTGIIVNADDVAVNAAYVKGLFSATDSGGDGSFTYSDGVFTYTGPSATEVRAHFSAGTGVTITNGQVAIGQAVGTTNNVTFNDLTVSGNLTVSGTTTTVNTETINLADNIIVLNSNEAGTPSQNAGIEIERGTSTNKTLVWDETADKWTVGTDTFVAATFEGALTGNVTGAVTGTVSSIANHSTTNLSEGTNLYFTAARARGNISVTDSGGDGSLSYDNSTGVITYTGPSATEVRAHFTAGTGVTISSGQVSIGQAVGTTSNVSFNNVTATGNFFGNLTGNVTGNAGTATTLATARNIGGVSFNGSASIDLPGVNTAGNQNTTGNAGTATKWATARTITLTGDVTGVSGDFDGSGNLSFATTIAANSVALGTDTTGNYVASVANGAYITGGAAGSEGATLTLAVDATTTATASKVAARDASGDLYAAIFQGTASSARYADLAERYEADTILEPGTVVCFGGEKEIKACNHPDDHAVAGVVSTDPAYMMNSAAGNNDTHPYIALTGRVPVKVFGQVMKGDLLVSSSYEGHAVANNNAKAGTIIGKAITSNAGGAGVIEALINLM